MLIRRETAHDVAAIHAITEAAFGQPLEANLVDELRADQGWIPGLSLVAIDPDATLVGHVVCTRGWIDGAPALGLGPLSVLPTRQRSGVGSALMHAVLGAADAMGEKVVVLLGHLDYYPRFGFLRSTEYGIQPPDPEWGNHFMARALSAYDGNPRGTFTYAEPFSRI